MSYGDFKDLPGRTALDKILCDKAFNIAKDPKYDRYHQRRLASTAYKFFDKSLLALILPVVLLKLKLYQTKN